jgi:hypothetical protein
MVSFCSFKISLLNACTVLIFFIAGLLFAPRARRSLGAYRIPLETGLLMEGLESGTGKGFARKTSVNTSRIPGTNPTNFLEPVSVLRIARFGQ